MLRKSGCQNTTLATHFTTTSPQKTTPNTPIFQNHPQKTPVKTQKSPGTRQDFFSKQNL
jgi:hypothetical protein